MAWLGLMPAFWRHHAQAPPRKNPHHGASGGDSEWGFVPVTLLNGGHAVAGALHGDAVIESREERRATMLDLTPSSLFNSSANLPGWPDMQKRAAVANLGIPNALYF